MCGKGKLGSAKDRNLGENPRTSKQGFKPVVKLFRHQATELAHLSYRRERVSRRVSNSGTHDSEKGGGSSDDDPDGPATLVGTPSHPFWSLTRNRWTGMGRLQVGELLLLADGGTARITATRTEHRARPTTVYNFEVADWHTYHVGSATAGWVWVHNLCKLGKRQARSLIRRGVDPRDAIRLAKSGKLKGPGVYKFTAESGETYVGQSANLLRRIKQHLKSGKLLPEDVGSIQTFRPKYQSWVRRRILEQRVINRYGGIDHLANKYNAIAERLWSRNNIAPPRE